MKNFLLNWKKFIESIRKYIFTWHTFLETSPCFIISHKIFYYFNKTIFYLRKILKKYWIFAFLKFSNCSHLPQNILYLIQNLRPCSKKILTCKYLIPMLKIKEINFWNNYDLRGRFSKCFFMSSDNLKWALNYSVKDFW